MIIGLHKRSKVKCHCNVTLGDKSCCRLAIERLENRLHLSTAKLDGSFAGTGYVLGPTDAPASGPFFSTAEGIVELPNGQTLVAGQVSIGTVNGLYVKRYNSDGSIDDTFGVGDGYHGASGYSFIGGNLCPVAEVPEVQAVTRLVVDAAGDIFVGEFNSGIVKLSDKGSTDTSFGNAGFLPISKMTDLAIAANTQILVTTSAGICEEITNSGAVNDNFGAAGQTKLSISLGALRYIGYLANSLIKMPIEVESDGSILIGGSDSNGDLAVQLLSSSGVVDNTFGSNGIASASFNTFYPSSDGQYNVSESESIDTVNNGDIVVGGAAFVEELNNVPELFVAAEFSPSGQLVQSFGTGGEIAQITSGNSESYEGTAVDAVVLPQSDGDIIFAGSTDDESNPYDSEETSWLLLAVNSSGQFDNTFGEGGELTTQFTASETDNNGPADIMDAAVETPDGKIIAVGDASPEFPGAGDVIARFIVEPPLPTVSIANTSATAGQSLQFKVTTSTPAFYDISLQYSVDPGSTPVSDLDEEGGTLTIPAGETSVILDVPTYGDSTGAPETCTIILASVSSNALFTNDESTESAIGTIEEPVHTLMNSEISLASSQVDVSTGSPLTLTAQVTGGTTIPTGFVTFFENGSMIGSVPLDNDGNASLQTILSSAGTQALTADYGGDANYKASSSVAATVDVSLAASVTTISTSAQTLLAGQLDTFMVAVAAAGRTGPVPTGNVTIYQDGIACGTYALESNGEMSASLNVSSSTGETQFTAVYAGNANYASSTSSALSVMYLPASSVVSSISASTAPADAISGQPFHAHLPVEIEDKTSVLKGKLTISLYLDKAADGLDGKQIELKSITKKLTLGMGRSWSFPFILNSLPSSVSAGNYHFVAVVVDPKKDFDIVTSSQTVVVTSPFVAFQLLVSPIIPASLSPGAAGNLTLSIKNAGNITAKGVLSLTVSAADPAGSQAELALSKSLRFVAIRPNTTESFRLRLRVPRTASAGNVVPIAIVTLDHITVSVNTASLAIQ